MSKIARRLGRGLDSLVSDLRAEMTPEAAAPPRQSPGESIRTETTPKPVVQAPPTSLPVEDLVPNPFQPRGPISEQDVAALAKSIQRNGILQPIPVRRVGSEFQIIAGERRWTAAKLVGLAEVPVVVRVASDEQMLELALIENLHREDLNAIDRAKAYRNFCGRFNLKPEELAERLGEDRTTVTNYLRLLELPAEVRDLLAAGKLSMGHARCLLGVNEETRQCRMAAEIVKGELSVRVVEEIIRQGRALLERANELSPEAPARRLTAPHIADMQRRFEEALKTKVRIEEGKRKGSGRLIIDFYSLDDFDRIAEVMGVDTER